MTGITTREERNELRRLYEAALPGTWVADSDCVLSRDGNESAAVVADCQAAGPAVDDANAALIAAARNMLPRLLDTIDALEERNERMLRLLAGFAYRDWSECTYAASCYDTSRKPDSWFDDLQRSFELLLRGERDWGGFWDGEIHDGRIVDAMRRALGATWPRDTASVLEQLKRLAPNALGTDGRYPFVEDPIYGMYCTFCNSEADEMNSISHTDDCEWARLWNAVIEK